LVKSGDISSYSGMYQTEEINIQRETNCQLRSTLNTILINIHLGVPYACRIENKEKVFKPELYPIDETYPATGYNQQYLKHTHAKDLDSGEFIENAVMEKSDVPKKSKNHG
jgi:hypothetical protein